MQPPCVKRRRIDFEIIHPEMAWNEEMDAFYNHTWGFELDAIAEGEIPLQWSELSNSSKQGTKCGISGQSASSGLSVFSLKCGERTDSFEDESVSCVRETSTVCELCGFPGHSKYNCPNFWDFCHSTIDMASATQYSMLEDPRNFQFNSISGEQSGGIYERFLKATKHRS